MEEKNKRFTIIIPMHDAEEFILNALESVKKQEFEDYECIVIDDHSKDKSKELVENYITSNPNVNMQFYETPEGKWGPGTARNIGLDSGTGEYVLFLDADDELNDEKSLKNISEAIDKNELVEVLILGFQRKWRDRHDKVLLETTFKPQEKHTDKHYQIGRNNEGTIWSGCWKKSLFDNNKIRFPENTVWEDLIPKLELFNSADSEKIKICSCSTHQYNVRPGKSIGTTPTISKLKSMIELHRKCAKLISEGKIDAEYEKDIKRRIRNSPALIAWMMGMALYTKVLRNIPEKIDEVKRRLYNRKEICEDSER